MTLAAWSAVKLRPIASTKSPSGSVSYLLVQSSCASCTTQHTHQIEVNAVINQVVLARLGILGRAKVHPIRLASILDLLVVARQPNEIRVELGQVFLEYARVVARGVACNHDGEEDVSAFGDDFVVHEGHFVEFVGADVGAVGEAEVDL